MQAKWDNAHDDLLQVLQTISKVVQEGAVDMQTAEDRNAAACSDPHETRRVPQQLLGHCGLGRWIERSVGGRYQPAEDDAALGLKDSWLRPQVLQRAFEVRRVGGADAEEGVGIAGDGVCLLNLGVTRHDPCDLDSRRATAAVQLDKHLDAVAESTRIERRMESGDHSGLDQSIDPTLHGGCGEPDLGADDGEAGPCIALKPRNDPPIEPVQTQRIIHVMER